MDWYVYIIRSQSGEWLYTGIAIDPDKRLHQHNHTKKGARFTKRDRPWSIVHLEGPLSHTEALRRERDIKKLSRQAKEELVKST